MHLVRPASLAIVLVAARPALAEAQATPGGAWRQYATPAEAGYSATKLDAARRYADSVRSGAVMAVVRGSVLAAWGDVSRPLELHSVRKSIVNAVWHSAADGRRHEPRPAPTRHRRPAVITPQEKRRGSVTCSGALGFTCRRLRRVDRTIRPARGSSAGRTSSTQLGLQHPRVSMTMTAATSTRSGPARRAVGWRMSGRRRSPCRRPWFAALGQSMRMSARDLARFGHSTSSAEMEWKRLIPPNDCRESKPSPTSAAARYGGYGGRTPRDRGVIDTALTVNPKQEADRGHSCWRPEGRVGARPPRRHRPWTQSFGRECGR